MGPLHHRVQAQVGVVLQRRGALLFFLGEW
jgi:hypothetical protein